MGRTVPSYRIVTEMEKSKWKSFRQALDKKDRKIFDEMFSYSPFYNTARVGLANLSYCIRSLCLIFEHYKQINELEAAIKK
ncbi:MAG: hypothetical protein ACP5OH_02165 [Nitrososphaerota archaeon]